MKPKERKNLIMVILSIQTLIFLGCAVDNLFKEKYVGMWVLLGFAIVTLISTILVAKYLSIKDKAFWEEVEDVTTLDFS